MNTNSPSRVTGKGQACSRAAMVVTVVLLGAAFALLAPVPRAEAAVTATVAGGVLQVTGDAANNTISIRVAPGDPSRLEVLVGDTTVIGAFLRSTFTTITVHAGDGNDEIRTDRFNGEVTERLSFFGEGGIDSISGGANDDLLDGGDDFDRFTWRPGDGNDIVEGGNGNDEWTFTGSDDAEIISIASEGKSARFQRNVGNVSLELRTVEILLVRGQGGDDVISATTAEVVLVGGSGNDTLLGGPGGDVLNGEEGNDVMVGGRGDDVLKGEEGDDLFIWEAGDGRDTIDGRDGNDSLRVNGSAATPTQWG